MALIRRTPTAVRDLKGIWFHIAETGDTAAADRLLDETERRVRLLSEVPGIGRPRFDLRPRLRSSPVGKYLIFYRAIRGGIDVVRVIHGAMDLRRQFRRR